MTKGLDPAPSKMEPHIHGFGSVASRLEPAVPVSKSELTKAQAEPASTQNQKGQSKKVQLAKRRF